MFRRFLRSSLVSQARLGPSHSGSVLAQSNTLNFAPTYKSLYSSTSYNFSQASLIKNTLIDDLKISSQDIKNFREKASQTGLETSISFLSKATRLHHPNSNADLAEIFKAVEQRWTSGHNQFSKPEAVIALARLFGSFGLGSHKFWEGLTQRFSDLLVSNVYNLTQIAHFADHATRFKIVNEDFWSIVEKKLFDVGPAAIPGETAVALMMALAQNHGNKTFENAQYNVKRNEEEISFETQPLFILLKEIALKRISNLSCYSLLNLANIIARGVRVEEGFWLEVEDRFNELSYSLSAKQVADFASIFGQAKKGTVNFWNDIEKYTITSIKFLHDNEVSILVKGFGLSDNGSVKFWDSTQQHAINNNNKYSSNSIANASIGFALGGIAKSRLWEALEERALETIPKTKNPELAYTVYGFGHAKKGSEALWNAIEERALNIEDTLDQRFLMYTHLKQANKLTPKLAAHYNDVAEMSNFYTQENEEGEDVQEDKSQIRAL